MKTNYQKINNNWSKYLKQKHQYLSNCKEYWSEGEPFHPVSEYILSGEFNYIKWLYFISELKLHSLQNVTKEKYYIYLLNENKVEIYV